MRNKTAFKSFKLRIFYVVRRKTDHKFGSQSDETTMSLENFSCSQMGIGHNEISIKILNRRLVHSPIY